MKNWMRLTLVVVAFAAGAQPVRAQEEQVPVDTAGRLMEIDRALAVRIGLFVDEHPDFQVARLFRAQDSSHVLELTLRRDERTLRQRNPMTREEVDTLRARVSAALVAQPIQQEELNQDGRTMLIAGASALGVGFYGWAVPVVLGLSGKGIVAGYMFTTAASIVVPYLYTDDRPVTYGMTNAWWWGATRGIVHGVELITLIDDSVPSSDAFALATLAGSLGEGIAGYAWAERSGMSAGTAHTIGISSDFGQAGAGAIMLIALPEGGRIVPGGLLAGGAAGLVAGTSYAEKRDYTWGDAEVLRAVTLVGAADGVALWDLLTDGESDTDARILGAALLGGSTAGFMYADRHLRGLDFSVGQSILIDLAGSAGYAFGAGIGVLVSDESEPFTTLGAIGATAGVLLGMHGLADDARRRDRERWDDGRLRIQLNPWALAGLTAVPGRATITARAAGPAASALPFLSVRYTF